MASTTYVCERYPGLSIGSTVEREVKFRRGRFVATEKWQKRLIESNEWFGCHIHKVEDHAIEPVLSGGPAPEQRPHRDGTANPPVEEVLETEEEPAPEQPAAPTDYIISDTAHAILAEAGFSVADAAAKLELADGDRLTVKMAEGIIDG